MTLDEYITKNKTPVTAFARQLGVTRCAVHTWISGRKMPSPANQRRIAKITGGAVTANDFYGIADKAK